MATNNRIEIFFNLIFYLTSSFSLTTLFIIIKQDKRNLLSLFFILLIKQAFQGSPDQKKGQPDYSKMFFSILVSGVLNNQQQVYSEMRK